MPTAPLPSVVTDPASPILPLPDSRNHPIQVSVPESTARHPFALLALSADTRSPGGLPIEAHTFPRGRLLHRALASIVDELRVGSAAMTLLGRDGTHVAREGHRHAHILHLDLDGDGHLDHVLIWAPAGLDSSASRVLDHLAWTWSAGGTHEMPVTCAAVGDAGAMRSAVSPREGSQVLESVLGPPAGARVWLSQTPFVAPRFTKKRGKDSLEGQVQECLQRRGFPPARLEVLDPRDAIWMPFRSYLLHAEGHEPPVRRAHGIRLTFPEPVQGPVCLGFGSHYGLGRFGVAMDEEGAALLRLAEKTVYATGPAGEITAVKIRGQWRLERAELDRRTDAQPRGGDGGRHGE